MISAAIPAEQSMTLESLRRVFGRRPDLGGRLGQRWLEARSSAFAGNLVPRKGTVNVGGRDESPQFKDVRLGGTLSTPNGPVAFPSDRTGPGVIVSAT